MNYYTFKISESENGYYVYFVYFLDDEDRAMKTFEYAIASTLQSPISQYLIKCDIDCKINKIKCEKVFISPVDVINKNLPQDIKCMNISDDFVSLIPPPTPF